MEIFKIFATNLRIKPLFLRRAKVNFELPNLLLNFSLDFEEC